ncbi:dephospho-CoA kinase [Campylobacter sp. MIT 12-5580]|uniref:dephospho-CoA kinase n=1 Tax=Campylobacter sp. MIT 12-5580 TaxID=2040651 RepID=UPI0010F45911|nr:dephospho-CoA kinase [Campylobacter sp. MIT 12-5580]TKX30383.1 dephospho-CoA kinase [Campylobacter sp. MIT 12-5580]
MSEVFFVTASIACGKSTFMQIAKNKGFKVLNADMIAHELLDENALKIAGLFDDKSLIKEQKIDRKALANIVFNDHLAKEKLENFLHPKIRTEIIKQIELLKNFSPIFVELPLFFETKAYFELGKSILIYAPKELSLKRLMQRDSLSKKEALQRLEAQMDIEKKLELADFVIKNEGNLEEFKQNCEEFFDTIKLLNKGKNEIL